VAARTGSPQHALRPTRSLAPYRHGRGRVGWPRQLFHAGQRSARSRRARRPHFSRHANRLCPLPRASGRPLDAGGLLPLRRILCPGLTGWRCHQAQQPRRSESSGRPASRSHPNHSALRPGPPSPSPRGAFGAGEG
jgi:hypothetical protein